MTDQLVREHWEMLADEASRDAVLRIGLSNDTGARGLDIGYH
jgi:hypothetical protein